MKSISQQLKYQSTIKRMSIHICQHCGFRGDRKDFPNTTSICKQCIRNRPIAWKATLWCIFNLVDDKDKISTELKEVSDIRGKTCHEVQSMSKRRARVLMDAIEFDTRLYPIWYESKQKSQTEKGGGGSYADVCRRVLFNFINNEKDEGRFILKSISKYLSSDEYLIEKEDISWVSSPVAVNKSNHETKDSFDAMTWQTKYLTQNSQIKGLKKKVAEMEEIYIAKEAKLLERIYQLTNIINCITGDLNDNK